MGGQERQHVRQDVRVHALGRRASGPTRPCRSGRGVRLVRNLVENAVRHNHPKGARPRDEGGLTITVELPVDPAAAP
ncbi:hypothetical protein ABGB18_04575 [Nonomuraea sp. B12E4]|uniref:hypothetical protein n=1 Tax=Nonomuraea sp. B12E4 TaxID=3153564 RepID=UPI00325E56B8